MVGKLYAAAHAWVSRENLFLLTKRSATTRYMPAKWDIPGGTIEWGESPQEALKREIEEETQIKVDIGAPIFVYNNMVQFPDRQTLQIVFECTFRGGEVHLNPREHTEFRWVTREEAQALDRINFVSDFMSQLS